MKVGSPSFTHARIQSKTPDWDTTDVIGGFIAEKKIDRNIDLQSKALLNAMDSWVWVLDKNLLMP